MIPIFLGYIFLKAHNKFRPIDFLGHRIAIFLGTLNHSVNYNVMAWNGKIITPSVLIVEDKTIIRLCLIDAFSDAGFRVSDASDADEAIDILRREASRIHVIFTDVNMPGQRNGMELVHYVRQHWPWIALLVTSGRVTPDATELPPRSRFLPKPYDTLAVIEHVRELTQAA